MVRGGRRVCCALLATLVAFPLGAEVGRVDLESRVTDDSDDASQYRQLARYRHFERWGGVTQGFGIGGGRWWFDDPTGEADFDVLELAYEVSGEATEAEFRLRQLDGDGWRPTLGEMRIAHRFGDRWYGELFFERNLVDSVPAISRELILESGGFSLDYRVLPRLTLVAAVLTQDISDGNEREGGIFRVVYDVPRIKGLTLQTRSLRLDSDFDGVGYFSPEKREEHLLLLGYTRPVLAGRFVFRTEIGPGWQRLENGFGDVTRNDLLYAEVGLRGWFNDHFGVDTRATCSNTGGPSAGPANDYRYCSAEFSLIASW